MNKISSKNDLQEYLQKNKLSLPKYLCFPIENTKWICRLEVNSHTYISLPCDNKSSAEKFSADLALKDINNTKVFVNLNVSEDQNILICVDIENKQYDIVHFVKNVKSCNISIVGFISEGHSFLLKMAQIPEYKDPRVEIVIVPSTRKDASDIGLSFILGSYISKSVYRNYIIISGDHFATVLGDCINGNILKLSDTPKAYSFSNIQQSISFLSKEM